MGIAGVEPRQLILRRRTIEDLCRRVCLASLALCLTRRDIVGPRAPLEILLAATGPISSRLSRPIVCPQAISHVVAMSIEGIATRLPRGRVESRPEKKKKDDAPARGMTAGD
jgi:hypothetical protein